MKHLFQWNENGQLEHYIDDVLRATIEREHVLEYRKNFPGVTVPDQA